MVTLASLLWASTGLVGSPDGLVPTLVVFVGTPVGKVKQERLRRVRGDSIKSVVLPCKVVLYLHRVGEESSPGCAAAIPYLLRAIRLPYRH